MNVLFLDFTKTGNGKSAIIFVDSNTHSALHSFSNNNTSSDSDSLPFTVKDLRKDAASSLYESKSVRIFYHFFFNQFLCTFLLFNHDRISVITMFCIVCVCTHPHAHIYSSAFPKFFVGERERIM